MEYKWIGWMQEGTSDKVWGVITIVEDFWNLTNHGGINFDGSQRPGKYCTFWGRRGKKLQTKIVEGFFDYDISSLINKKTSKGYNKVELTQLNEVYPEFEDDLKKTAFWASFKV